MSGLKRIVIHWSGGTHSPNSTDLEHYHFLVDGNGEVHNGQYTPEANIDCKDGIYARHTGGGNTGSIGVAMCGMLGFKSKANQGNYPLTKIQFEATMKLCAQLCNKYGIEITPDTVTTHYEFNIRNEISSGKIDIIFIPPYPWVSKHECASFIRSKVRWYQQNI